MSSEADIQKLVEAAKAGMNKMLVTCKEYDDLESAIAPFAACNPPEKPDSSDPPPLAGVPTPEQVADGIARLWHESDRVFAEKVEAIITADRAAVTATLRAENERLKAEQLAAAGMAAVKIAALEAKLAASRKKAADDMMLAWGGVMPENSAWPGDSTEAAEAIRAVGCNLNAKLAEAERRLNNANSIVSATDRRLEALQNPERTINQLKQECERLKLAAGGGVDKERGEVVCRWVCIDKCPAFETVHEGVTTLHPLPPPSFFAAQHADRAAVTATLRARIDELEDVMKAERDKACDRIADLEAKLAAGSLPMPNWAPERARALHAALAAKGADRG